MLQITFIPNLTYQGSPRALIEGVRIAAALRGGGVGQRLFEWAIERARERGCRLVQLTSDKARPDAIRFYERIGLLTPDRRHGTHRRFSEATLRRLVFIGMLQDAGLSLDEIAGILSADRVADWKRIARGRLADLNAQIERLQGARAYLEGALLCRYDHPATDCEVMAREIDRRLAEAAPQLPGAR